MLNEFCAGGEVEKTEKIQLDSLKNFIETQWSSG